MALDRVLHSSAPLRTPEQAQQAAAQSKANRCETLSAAELALLSRDELIAFEARATRNAARCRPPYKHADDSELWEAEYEAMAKSARAEIVRRAADQTAISVHENDAELWTGSLTDFLLDNMLEPEEVAIVRDRLARDGRASIGGGAAPLFTIICVDRAISGAA